MKKNSSKQIKEPIDVSKFTTLEDLILAAMGPPDKNIVNFKMVQAILMILAQQLRMLERPVDYRSLEETTASRETEKAERETEKPERDTEKPERDTEKPERDTEKPERDTEKPEKESKIIEKDSEKSKRASEESEKKGDLSQKDSKLSTSSSEKATHESKKSERESEKSESESEIAEKESKKAGREKEKTRRDKEKTSREKEKTGREREKAEGEKEKKGQEREKTEEKKEKEERESDKTEQGRENTETEREKKGPEEEKKKEKKEKKGREDEKKEEKKGRDRENIELEREKTEGEKEKKGREREKTEQDRKQTEGEKEKKGREREKTEQDREQTEGKKEKTKHEKEKTEREEDKTEGKKEKKGREEEKTKEKKERDLENTEQERVKTEGKKEKKGRQDEKTEDKEEKKGRDRENTEQEREKTEGEKEKKGREREKTEQDREQTEGKKEKTRQEKEKTERVREKTGREKEETGREREKTGRKREKTGQEREKTGQEREKTGQEREKTGQEREKIGRQRDEKVRNIPSSEKPDREEEEKDQPSTEEYYISVTDKDRVLVVENLPASRRGTPQSSVGSIPVVTLSQFKILEAAVRALEEKATPIPLPSMPDNRTLRDELAKGSASLTDTMDAMQVSARVQAAEEAINRMAELLSDMAAKQKDALEKAPGKDRLVKLQIIDSDSSDSSDDTQTTSSEQAPRTPSALAEFSKRNTLAQKSSIFGVRSRTGNSREASLYQSVHKPEPKPTDFVSHPEMTNALSALQATLVRSLGSQSALIQKTAEATSKTVQMAADRAALVVEVDDRIKKLTALLNKRAEQHANIDAGTTALLETFNVQLVQVKVDLRDGLILFESSGSEMQALKELGSKYDELVEMLDMTSHSHSELASGQNMLNDHVKDILACIEMLQEEKSDRDEMLDGLRDKAGLSALCGLLPASKFREVQADFEEKLGQCHGKFRSQETVWQSVIDEMMAIVGEKSDLYQLLKLKEDTEQQLKEINKKLRCLAYALGEPKAALLARQVSQGGRCGACSKPAIQNAVDKSYIKDENDQPIPKPARLPPAYYSYIGAGDPCEVETNAPTMDEAKQHVCHRWVGGSHTLLNDSVKRAKVPPLPPLPPLGPPTKKYINFGDDGKIYKMEETLDPCRDCKPTAGEEVRVDGAGDTAQMALNVHILGGLQTAEK